MIISLLLLFEIINKLTLSEQIINTMIRSSDHTYYLYYNMSDFKMITAHLNSLFCGENIEASKKHNEECQQKLGESREKLHFWIWNLNILQNFQMKNYIMKWMPNWFAFIWPVDQPFVPICSNFQRFSAKFTWISTCRPTQIGAILRWAEIKILLVSNL